MNTVRQEFPRATCICARRRRWIVMRQLTLLITGLQVLAHGVFGCCAHEGRASAECAHAAYCYHAGDSAPTDPVHAHQYVSTDGHAPACMAGHDRPDSDHQPQHQCPHDACQWIVQKQAAPEGHVVPLTYLPAMAHADSGVAGNLLTVSQSAPSPTYAPPLRLHLWVCVLLI